MVLGWEINGWSVEGLRRGAARNGWDVEVVVGGESSTHHHGKGEGDGKGKGQGNCDGTGNDKLDIDAKILVFRESNVHATTRINHLRASLQPIRHVNCGLLPTSRHSWPIAVQALDPVDGGWIHIHENVAVGDIQAVAVDIGRELRELVSGHGDGMERRVECEHIERVKTFAPGVMHCVFDFCVSLVAISTNIDRNIPTPAPTAATM